MSGLDHRKWRFIYWLEDEFPNKSFDIIKQNCNDYKLTIKNNYTSEDMLVGLCWTILFPNYSFWRNYNE